MFSSEFKKGFFHAALILFAINVGEGNITFSYNTPAETLVITLPKPITIID